MYGERIKERRKLFGLTRKELALQVMTTTENIKLWEEELIAPTINDLILLADALESSVDWLLGLDEEDEENCEYCEDFLQCKLIPHMRAYMKENEDPAYIHLQLSLGGEGSDCIIYSGGTNAVLAAVNLMLSSLAKEIGIDYYDLVALMATTQAKATLGGLNGDE